MCGIMGYIGDGSALEVILKGLAAQEYRGYDSAGVALKNPGEGMDVVKTVGRVSLLEERFNAVSYASRQGIGHTRWATHGGVSEINAHPHTSMDGSVVLVHNGIIENAASIRERMVSRGTAFSTETDTESAVQLLAYNYSVTGDPLESVKMLCSELEGAYALVIMFRDREDSIWCARKGSPLVIACSQDAGLCASDPAALLEYSRRLYFVDECEIAAIEKGACRFFSFTGEERAKEPLTADWDVAMKSKGDHSHYMHKEIYEQPEVIRRTMQGRCSGGHVDMSGEFSISPEEARRIKRVHLIACGTSYYAALVAGNMMESLGSNLDIRVDIASEYRYRKLPGGSDTLALFVSQSGETADTLAAARLAKSRGMKCIALTNVRGSTIDRESSFSLISQAGPEVGVAATKTFTGQISLLTLFSLYLLKIRGELSEQDESRIVNDLYSMPEKVDKILGLEKDIEKLAARHKDRGGFFFLGRGASLPAALEGALKMKEISYVHSEAFPAGEMKHGPIAMLDDNLAVIAFVPDSPLMEKTVSNVEECLARKAPVVIVSSEGSALEARLGCDSVKLPSCEEETYPFVGVVFSQLLAYHVANLRGCDIDMPRNLAKSVTVE